MKLIAKYTSIHQNQNLFQFISNMHMISMLIKLYLIISRYLIKE